MKDSELQSAIHFIDPKRGQAPSGFVDIVDGEVGYGIGAAKIATQVEIGSDNQRRQEDNPDCFCKLIVVQGTPVFYIKSDMSNRLANPWDAVTSVSQEQRFSKRTGRSAWKFIKVNQECFEFYLKFLDTRNTNYYRTCERMSKNG